MLSARGPRTRVPRLWLLHLSPDQVHGSPSREPLPDSDQSFWNYSRGTVRWQGLLRNGMGMEDPSDLDGLLI